MFNKKKRRKGTHYFLLHFFIVSVLKIRFKRIRMYVYRNIYLCILFTPDTSSLNHKNMNTLLTHLRYVDKHSKS